MYKLLIEHKDKNLLVGDITNTLTTESFITKSVGIHTSHHPTLPNVPPRSYFGPTHTEPRYTFIAPTFIEIAYQYQDIRRTLLLLSPRTIVQWPTNTNFKNSLIKSRSKVWLVYRFTEITSTNIDKTGYLFLVL